MYRFGWKLETRHHAEGLSVVQFSVFVLSMDVYSGMETSLDESACCLDGQGSVVAERGIHGKSWCQIDERL